MFYVLAIVSLSKYILSMKEILNFLVTVTDLQYDKSCLHYLAGENESIVIFLWESGQTWMKKIQTIPFRAANMVHAFMPPSGLGTYLSVSNALLIVYSYISINKLGPLVALFRGGVMGNDAPQTG